MGLVKRVIFTCRKNAIDDLHFAVRQYNTIVGNAGDYHRAFAESYLCSLRGRAEGFDWPDLTGYDRPRLSQTTGPIRGSG